MWRRFRFALRMLLWLVVAYLGINLIGLIPVNNGFQPSLDGIEIIVISNAVHADIVVPIETDTINWRDHFPSDVFAADVSEATHVAIGWGDRGFFLNTPTWGDLRASTVASALFWPTGACMHVRVTSGEYERQTGRAVRISPAEYARLVDFIQASFVQVDGANVPIEGAAYGAYDAFFAARGTYHGLNTCNSWAGRALRAGGIRTGWLTPLPGSVYLYLPTE